MRDALVVLTLSTAAGAWVTTYFAIAFGLTARPPRWRGAVAIVVPPLGLYWAFRERLFFRASVNVISAALYLGALLLARR
jgi:hypothetical protein